MPETLFAMGRALATRLAADDERIADAIQATDEGTTLSTDENEWARNLANRMRAQPPGAELGRAHWEDLGPAQVDCTHMGGITYTTAEFGRPIIRDGRRLVLHLPVSGDVELLRYWPAGGCAPVEADIAGDEVTSTWEWPLVKGRDELETHAQSWIGQLRDGADRVAAQVEEHNGQLEGIALKAISDRRAYLRQHTDFLIGMSLPIAPREERPRSFTLPPVRRRQTAATELADAAPPVPHGPQLGELYDEILRKHPGDR
jgi:hypothetical protein